MSKWEVVVASLVLVVVGVVARLLPHVPNFAPITATALFCGAYMNRRYSVYLPIAILLLSDYLLLYINPYGQVNFSHLYAPWDLYHNTLPYVYASFGISALMGWLLTERRTALNIVAASLFCSIQFFMITNAAVWIEGAYARGIDGLWQSYVAGIPFFKGTLAGDLLYTTAFFGLYEMVRRERLANAQSSARLPGAPATF